MKTSPASSLSSFPSAAAFKTGKNPSGENSKRNRKKLSSYIPLPIIWPGILLGLLLFSIAQAQTQDTLLLFQEDFHWANNAWNSSKAAQSPFPEQSFDGKVYQSRKCIKLASSSQDGCIHLRLKGIPRGKLMLTGRGARYDKSKPPCLETFLLSQQDTLFADTLYFCTYYKDGDEEPYRQYDSMNQADNGFASSDTLFWETEELPYPAEVSVLIRARANHQTFLDRYALHIIPQEEQATIQWHPDTLLLMDSVGQWTSNSLKLQGQNLLSNLRMQVSGPDKSISIHPMHLSANELNGKQVSIRIEARVDSIGKSYQLSCWHETDSHPLACIPIIVHPYTVDMPSEPPQDSGASDCQPPKNLQISNISASMVDFQWESEANRFQIRIGDLFSVVQQITTEKNYLTAYNLVPGTWYWWEVAAICGEQDSSGYAKGETFLIPGNQGNKIHDWEKSCRAMISPNPSSGRISLSLPFDCQVRIFSLQGLCLYSQKLSKGMHSLQINQKGIFLLHYGNPPEHEQTLRFIVL